MVEKKDTEKNGSAFERWLVRAIIGSMIVIAFGVVANSVTSAVGHYFKSSEDLLVRIADKLDRHLDPLQTPAHPLTVAQIEAVSNTMERINTTQKSIIADLNSLQRDNVRLSLTMGNFIDQQKQHNEYMRQIIEKRLPTSQPMGHSSW